MLLLVSETPDSVYDVTAVRGRRRDDPRAGRSVARLPEQRDPLELSTCPLEAL